MDTNMQDVDHLVLKVLDVQKIRKNMHQLQEDLNWERQNYESLQGEHSFSSFVCACSKYDEQNFQYPLKRRQLT